MPAPYDVAGASLNNLYQIQISGADRGDVTDLLGKNSHLSHDEGVSAKGQLSFAACWAPDTALR